MEEDCLSNNNIKSLDNEEKTLFKDDSDDSTGEIKEGDNDIEIQNTSDLDERKVKTDIVEEDLLKKMPNLNLFDENILDREIQIERKTNFDNEDNDDLFSADSLTESEQSKTVIRNKK